MYTSTEYKINTQKSFEFIYISEKLSEKEIRKIIILCYSTIKKKNFRNKFNQRGERPVNYKTWLKEIEDEGFLGCSVIKNPAANAGDTGSVPHPGRCHMQPSM